ncbi:ABC transporter related protein [Pyrobaculum islandicum DSM 4184]|uniref:ABC transporter related protein n=1 Tax=Pyrobaculum islandicum (strain DSM 4184 / JCM 9189 / GEO3) TaxID=384616 RepID=A1RTA3_PYRIL|nr:ABC transporter ATP-binding protein [Pyrobaculum islandicum]ABL88185.1 ABC transporter related protein [Pyrobaculum islandicum DSM 4184]
MAVELKNVTKVYGNGSVKTVALDDVSLSVTQGEAVVLMGPSGSGKTTLLNIIATLDRPTSGEVYVLGVDVAKMPERKLERFRLRNIGYLFQSYNLVPYLTAEQNVALPLVTLGVKKELALLKARLLLELVGLEKAAALYPHQMSGGMQQRVAVARALAANPPILILDEPTSNVDPDNASQVLGLIYVVNKLFKSTVFIATHDPEVARIATRLVYIRGGKLYETVEPPRRELKVDVERAAAVYEKLKHIDELIGI